MSHILHLRDSQDVQFKQHESCFFQLKIYSYMMQKKKAQKKYLASHSLQSFTILCRLEQQKTAVVVVVKKSFFPPDLFSNASVSIGSPFGIHAFGQKSVGNICADKKGSCSLFLEQTCVLQALRDSLASQFQEKTPPPPGDTSVRIALQHWLVLIEGIPISSSLFS